MFCLCFYTYSSVVHLMLQILFFGACLWCPLVSMKNVFCLRNLPSWPLFSGTVILNQLIGRRVCKSMSYNFFCRLFFSIFRRNNRRPFSTNKNKTRPNNLWKIGDSVCLVAVDEKVLFLTYSWTINILEKILMRNCFSMTVIAGTWFFIVCWMWWLKYICLFVLI